MGVVQAAQEKRLFRTGGERGCVITRGGGFALEEAVLECGGGGGGGWRMASCRCCGFQPTLPTGR